MKRKRNQKRRQKNKELRKENQREQKHGVAPERWKNQESFKRDYINIGTKKHALIGCKSSSTIGVFLFVHTNKKIKPLT